MTQNFNIVNLAALANDFTVVSMGNVTTLTKTAIKATITVEWDDDGNIVRGFKRDLGGSVSIGKQVLSDGRIVTTGDVPLLAIVVAWITKADRYYAIASDPMFVGG